MKGILNNLLGNVTIEELACTFTFCICFQLIIQNRVIYNMFYK